MKDAIAAQGIGGRITSLTAEKVAECSLKASRKNKAVIVPKFINKCILMFSKILGDVAISKIIEKKWKRSLQKRELK